LSLSGGAGCAILGHAQGITIEVTATDRGRLQSIVGDRNSPQKHVWRARIVLLSGDGLGTMAIMRAVGKGRIVVWRWQERFMQEGVAGLIRDKTRPSRIAALPAETVDRVIELTNPGAAASGDPLDRAGDGQDGRDQPVLGAPDFERAEPCAWLL
jgi:Winged helix-turn helix